MIYNLVAMKTFGQWLKENRKAKGLTQEQLAIKAGISPSYVSTLERKQPHSVTGADLRPEPDKVEKLAKALSQDIDKAMELAGYAPTKSADSYEVLDGVMISFQDDDLSKKQQQEIADIVRKLVVGVKAEKQNQ